MKTLLLTITILVTIALADHALAQTTGVQTGPFIFLDSPSGSSTQLQLNQNQGVIMDSKGNIEPYLMLPAPNVRTERGIQPLQPLPSLTPSNRNESFGEPNTFQSAPMFVPYSFGEAAQ